MAALGSQAEGDGGDVMISGPPPAGAGKGDPVAGMTEMGPGFFNGMTAAEDLGANIPDEGELSEPADSPRGQQQDRQQQDHGDDTGINQPKPTRHTSAFEGLDFDPTQGGGEDVGGDPAEEGEQPAPPQATRQPTRNELLDLARREFPQDAHLFEGYQSPQELLRAHANLRRAIGRTDDERTIGKVARENPAELVKWYAKNMPQVFEQAGVPITDGNTNGSSGRGGTDAASGVGQPDDAAYEDGRELNPEVFAYMSANMPANLKKNAVAYFQRRSTETNPTIKALQSELASIKQQLAATQHNNGQQQQQPPNVRQEVAEVLGFEQTKQAIGSFVNNPKHAQALFTGGSPRYDETGQVINWTQIGKDWATGFTMAEQAGNNVQACIDAGISFAHGQAHRRGGSANSNGQQRPNQRAASHERTRTPTSPRGKRQTYRKEGESISNAMFRMMGLNPNVQ